jgi:hypothetical protein
MTTSQVLERPEAEAEEAVVQCKHHWVIESPHGATSQGVCKICHEVREFRNSAADSMWEGDPMASANRLASASQREPALAAPTITRDAE